MSTQDDVRRIAKALPGTIESTDRFAFSVENKGKAKGFAWVWLERIHPKKARAPQPNVLAVRVADQADKAALLAADPDTFFTEPHYNGYPAVLVRLPNITEPELRRVLVEGWRCMAPRALVAAYDADDAVPSRPSVGRVAVSPRTSPRPTPAARRKHGVAASASASRTRKTSRATARKRLERGR